MEIQQEQITLQGEVNALLSEKLALLKQGILPETVVDEENGSQTGEFADEVVEGEITVDNRN